MYSRNDSATHIIGYLGHKNILLCIVVYFTLAYILVSTSSYTGEFFMQVFNLLLITEVN